MFAQMSLFDQYAARRGGVIVLGRTAVAIRYNCLLFHSLAEIFLLVVAFSVFVLT